MVKSNFVYFNSRDELLRVDLSQVVYFEADGNYTHLVTANKLKLTLGMNLLHSEQRLAAHLGTAAGTFMRIGKRYIVNIAFICQVNMAKQQLMVTDYRRFNFVLPVSKDALKRVRELLVGTANNSAEK